MGRAVVAKGSLAEVKSSRDEAGKARGTKRQRHQVRGLLLRVLIPF